MTFLPIHSNLQILGVAGPFFEINICSRRKLMAVWLWVGECILVFMLIGVLISNYVLTDELGEK